MIQGQLGFIIPVRHQASVRDWPKVLGFLTDTLASIEAQVTYAWRCAVVANEGAVLPVVPDRCEIVRVAFACPTIPDAAKDREAFYNAIRDDKGARVLQGLRALAGCTHFMVVDYDDLVSPLLSSLVFSAPEAPGWFIDRGFIFSDYVIRYLQVSDFDEMCGTSLIIRHDLWISNAYEPSEEEIRYNLGSHKFSKRRLADAGTPLRPVRFPGASYRVGHEASSVMTAGIWRYVFPSLRLSLRHPASTLRRLTRIRFGSHFSSDTQMLKSALRSDR